MLRIHSAKLPQVVPLLAQSGASIGLAREITALFSSKGRIRFKTRPTRAQQSQKAVQRFAAARAANAVASPAAGDAASRSVGSLSLLPLLPPNTDPDRLYQLLAPPETAISRRVRHHVNPYRPDLIQPLPETNWADVFEDPSKPLIVDVGCASGRFLLAVASKLPHHNLLGLDIRSPLIVRAEEWAATLGVSSCVHFRVCNATVNYERMLCNYPGPIQMTLVQCPDPQFKTRHHKRRIVQQELAEAIANLTTPGGLVYLSSDVLEVSTNMRDIFEAFTGEVLRLAPGHPLAVAHSTSPAETLTAEETPPAASQLQPMPAAKSDAGSDTEGADWQPPIDDDIQGFPRSDCKNNPAAAASKGKDQTPWNLFDWLPNNPMGLPTERELSVLKQGGPMFRMLLCKPLLP